ncbi:MAG: acyl-CoA thioesterase [Gammaproteobacteria bacterium]|nr:acyl-CoA thioesterase [Gammaproteobacteria bacterium]
MTENFYRWDSTVRDYELDSQGIVNNAIYINYFEQCRNDFARALDIDFIEFHKAGYLLVVATMEVQYRLPLRAQDKFYVTATISGYDKKRVHFEQEIRRSVDDKLLTKALVHVACVDLSTGKAGMPDIFKNKFENFFV